MSRKHSLGESIFQFIHVFGIFFLSLLLFSFLPRLSVSVKQKINNYANRVNRHKKIMSTDANRRENLCEPV